MSQQKVNNSKCECGPGYRTPMDAFKNGTREKLMYVVTVRKNTKSAGKPDYLSVVDLDPTSPTYAKVIYRLDMPYIDDELHHLGWNACSSCHGDTGKKRSHLVATSFDSDRVYVMDVQTDPRKPRLHKVIEASEIHEKTGLGAPHTPHCLGNGDVMISCVGDPKSNAKGGFLLLNPDFSVKGNWEKESVPFGYDFWYQPKFNVMISTEFGAPSSFREGFDPTHVDQGHYGSHLNVWDWQNHSLRQRIDLEPMGGQIPMEIRFLHNPDKPEGFVCCSLTSNIFRFYETEAGDWAAEKVVQIPAKKVKGWREPEIGGLTTYLLLSLDDKYAYISNWLHGDVRQYDITDTRHPKLVGQTFIGGSIAKGSGVTVTEDSELKEQPDALLVGGRKIHGGPNMLQLSLDGKRLFVGTSLYSKWDTQYYPQIADTGSVMLMLDVDTEKGGLTLNKDFAVDFGSEPEGPVLIHEMHYDGGDVTSDIWLSTAA